MSKSTLSQKDRELIEESYSTTYRSTFERLIREAESDIAKEIIRDIMTEVELEN